MKVDEEEVKREKAEADALQLEKLNRFRAQSIYRS